MNNTTVKKALPIIMGALTALLYIATGCRGIDPAVSAGQVAQHLLLTPFPPLSHPIWGALIRAITAISPFSIAFTLNTLSALFMGTTSGMLCYVMISWNWTLVPEKYRIPRNELPATLIAAITAPLLFTVLLPVWIAGTRSTPISFDCMLLSMALLLVWRFYKDPSKGKLFTLAFVWGAGITEYSSFIVLSPIILLALVIMAWQAQMLKFRNILLFLLLFLAGLGIYVLMAWSYRDSQAYIWREFTGIHAVFWQLFRQQYLDLRNATVSLGWMLIVVMLIIPWLAVVVMPLSDRRRPRYKLYNYMLFVVFLIITIIVLLNIPPAPWHFTRLFPLLIFPYLLFASWAGRLAGTAYLILTSPDTFRRPFRALIKKVLIIVVPVLFAALIVTAAVRNYAMVNSRGADQVHRLAEQMVDHLNGRTRIISNGFLDNSVLIAAHEKDIDVEIINLGLGIQRGYRRYVGSLFEDTRLRNLATVGWQPLLEEWPNRSHTFTDDLAILQPADLWSRLGFTAVPAPLLYQGYDSIGSVDPATLQDAAAYWHNHADIWTRDIDPDNVSTPWYKAARQLVSQINNNLGIALQDKQMAAQAAELYQRAIDVENNNICAVMNLLALQNMEKDPAAEETDKLLERMIEEKDQQVAFWQLASRYGFIRDPAAYIAQGYAWAISGKPAAAIREVQRAIELSGETPAMKLLLANLYIDANETEDGLAEYAGLLENEPDNINALIGMTRLALRQNDIALARDYLTRLQKTGVDMSSPAIEGLVISMAIQTDDYPQIRSLLKDMLKKKPEAQRLWATLALLASQHGDTETAAQARQYLGSTIGSNPSLAIVLAQLEIKDGNYETACNILRDVVRHMPAEIPLHEQYLRLLVDLRRRDDAEEEAITILGMDPDNALANYIIGTLQNSRGEDALAEDSFRTSLKTERSPDALNDLAWLLAQRNEFEEALPLIQESLALRPENPNALDTAALIQMELAMLQQAELNITKALSYYPNNATLKYHHALILEKKGRTTESLQLAEPLLNRMPELSDADYNDLRELVARLRKQDANS